MLQINILVIHIFIFLLTQEQEKYEKNIGDWVISILKVNGLLFAYKGTNYEEEIKKSDNALKILNAQIKEIHKYELPNNLGSRAIIVIEKIAATNEKYPRMTGIPVKKPL